VRILHLIHSEGIYGAEAILLYLAREQQHGHEPLIGSIRDPGTAETPFESLARSWDLPVVPIRIAPRPTPPAIATLLRTVRAHSPDVLHSHGYKPNILLGALPRSRRGAMLTTLHGWTNMRRFSRMWLYERLDRLALARLDAVVLVAGHMLKLPAVRSVPAARLRVIENGIPPLALRLEDLSRRGAGPLPPALLKFMALRPTLVAIGRLSPEKDFPLLLEAFARARTRAGAQQQQLLIVGEGPQRGLLTQRIAALGLSPVVQLAGYVDGADRLLEHASGFVMSSLTEGLPLVLLEAMQWRVPVVATAVGAIPELLDGGHRGRLVAPGDLAAMTDALQSLMSGDTGTTGVAAAADAVTGHYSSARMAQEYLSAYGAVCASARQPAERYGRQARRAGPGDRSA
jgi:glycosyltransferase involved in cell wall biosynthesis